MFASGVISKMHNKYVADKSDLDCGDSTFQADQVIMYSACLCVLCVYM